MSLHKHQLYLLEEHSVSFKIWAVIIWINTKGKSLIMKLGPGLLIKHHLEVQPTLFMAKLFMKHIL